MPEWIGLSSGGGRGCVWVGVRMFAQVRSRCKRRGLGRGGRIKLVSGIGCGTSGGGEVVTGGMCVCCVFGVVLVCGVKP